jgi:hypothetical protein
MKRAETGRMNWRPSLLRRVKTTNNGRPALVLPTASKRSSCRECLGSGTTRGWLRKSSSISAMVTPCFLAFRPVAAVPIEAVNLKGDHSRELCKCIYKCKLSSGADIRSYFPANSFFTVSLTSLPSTRAPPNFAMTFFMTVPMSLMVGEPISAIVAFTAATMSASPIALGM